jgi:enoyl-CoA hydratase
MSAARLHALGYVNHVVPREQLLARSLELAERIAANAPLTVRACRALVYASTETGRTQALRAGDALFEPVYLSADAQEGPRAFAQKRPPQWQGK